MVQFLPNGTAKTRLHSSRMRTARALTASHSMVAKGGGRGLCLLGGEGCLLQGGVGYRGVSALGGGVSAPGGSAPEGVGPGGVCSGGLLREGLLWGVCSRGCVRYPPC